MYDFKSLISRKDAGSEKWMQMYACNPNVAEDVVPLSVADMELKNPPEVMEGLKEYLDNTVLGYTEEYDSYLEAVVNWQKRRHGFDVKKSWIEHTPGVINALYGAVRAFTNPGDGVIIMRPVYYPFTNAVLHNDRTLVNCSLIRDENNNYTMDLEKFEQLAKKPQNKMLIFCSPHNPTGRVWTKEELKEMGEIAAANQVIIVCDEIWNDLTMPGYKHTILASISPEISDITVTCTAPSKTFNLAGMHTSNIIISNDAMRAKYHDTLNKMRSLNIGILGYKACELAYNRSEKWMEELILFLDKNQRLVKDYFDTHHPQLTSNYLEATYLQWIDCRALGMSNEEMEKFMQYEAQFFTDEGYIFGIEGSGFERINVACPTEVLLVQLNKLTQALKKKGF